MSKFNSPNQQFIQLWGYPLRPKYTEVAQRVYSGDIPLCFFTAKTQRRKKKYSRLSVLAV
jgi:hypothetical protein